MKSDTDELYLIKDFLEEQLDIVKERWCETTEDVNKAEEDEFMFERTIELISKLIEENK